MRRGRLIFRRSSDRITIKRSRFPRRPCKRPKREARSLSRFPKRWADDLSTCESSKRSGSCPGFRRVSRQTIPTENRGFFLFLCPAFLFCLNSYSYSGFGSFLSCNSAPNNLTNKLLSEETLSSSSFNRLLRIVISTFKPSKAACFSASSSQRVFNASSSCR